MSSSPAVDVAHRPVWTKRERLSYQGSVPATPCCLPLFLHGGSAADDGESPPLPEVLLTEIAVQVPAKCSLDSTYEAVDHHLLWVPCPGGMGVKFLYSEPEPPLAQLLGEAPPSAGSNALQVQSPEEVLTLAEFFRDDIAAILSRWQLRAEKSTALQRISLQPLATSDGISSGQIGELACGLVGNALTLDIAVGYIALVKSLPQRLSAESSRFHLRAHYYDDGQEHQILGHWLGLATPMGIASVGLAFGLDGSYSFLTGAVPSGKSGEHHGWQRSFVERSCGWHCFEIVLEGSMVTMIVDGEPVCVAPSEGSCEAEEAWLVSRCGGNGVWAGVELMHTPEAKNTWDLGVQDVGPADRRPWIGRKEEGRWQADDEGIVRSVKFNKGTVAQITPLKHRLIESFSRVPEQYQYNPKMDAMLGKQYRVLKVNEDGMVALPALGKQDGSFWWFPPIAAALVAVEGTAVNLAQEAGDELDVEGAPLQPPSTSEDTSADSPPCAAAAAAGQQEVTATTPRPQTAPALTVGGLAIECWSIPNEEDVARVERVVAVFVEALQHAQIALPNDIHHIQECTSKQHAGCFVYSFGTRRLHVATRVTESGRLLLVVRCGGGFIDFIEFAKRHGSVEQLRERRALDSQGREVVRFTSVLSKGKVRAVRRSSRPFAF